MTQRASIFDGLVVNENSMTQLLRNLLRYSAFRRPLFSRLMSPSCATHIGDIDIKTQKRLKNNFGQPDLFIETQELCALIEVKVEEWCGRTANQPDGYFNYLLGREDIPSRWLIFLVPKRWGDWEILDGLLGKLTKSGFGARINAHIVSWDVVLNVIEDNNLQYLSPLFEEFRQLLASWFRPKLIQFVPNEVHMLVSKEFGATVRKLYELVEEIRKKGRVYEKSHFALGEIYFRNESGRDILWFGIWPKFWEEEGFAVCFGVERSWGADIVERFCNTYKGERIEFDDRGDVWTLGWVSAEILQQEDVAAHVWGQVDLILRGLLAGSVPLD